jgi:hypothetical protein
MHRIGTGPPWFGRGVGRRRTKRLGAAALAASAAMALVAGTPGAVAAVPVVPAVTVVADHLNNPRQIAVNDGTVYVAEAGYGGNTCVTTPAGKACIGFTGSVTRVRSGRAQRIQTGLLSVNSPEGDVVGVDDVIVHDGDLYGVASGACGLPKLPVAVSGQIGKVLKLSDGTRTSAVGDPGAFECANDPDHQGKDTDPYGLTWWNGRFYVADAAGNDVVSIRRGTVSLATVLATKGQPVPTSLAVGPDGALYIGTLNFEGGPGGAKIYRLAKGATGATVYASGLSAVTAIAFGRGGRLYASEFSTTFGPKGPGPNGDVVVIPKGGGTSGRYRLGVGALHFPAGVGVDGRDVYVTNWSIAPGWDSKAFGPGNHGKLVKLVDSH